MRNVPPTKSSLLKLRQELKLASLGYELLDQKRNILINELLSLVDQAEDYEGQVNRALEEAYRTLEQTVLTMGKRRLLHLASSINIEAELSISQRRVMGVPLPVVDTSFTEHGPFYSLGGTSLWVDLSLESFKAALELMGKLAQLKVSIVRLAQEVRKTIRKVNALEKIAIPDLKETVTYIEGSLEEHERDTFVLLKRIKSRLEKMKEI